MSTPNPVPATPVPTSAIPPQGASPSVRGPAASSFTLGLLSIVAGLFTGIPAIIMGVVAKRRGKSTGEKSALATAGITLGIIFTALNLIIATIAAIAAVNAVNTVQNEASTVRLDLSAAKMSLIYVGALAKAEKAGQTDGAEQTAAAAAAAKISSDGQTQVVVEDAAVDHPIHVALSNSHGCVTFTLVSIQDVQSRTITAPDVVHGADGTHATAVPGGAPICS